VIGQRKAAVLLAVVAGLCLSCGLREDANAKFGDQHFKTAIALIELHKVRTGAYPESLESIPFCGEWDAIAISSVRYAKDGAGYDLDVVNGWMGKPALSFPKAFWKGLGIVKSNVERDST